MHNLDINYSYTLQRKPQWTSDVLFSVVYVHMYIYKNRGSFFAHSLVSSFFIYHNNLSYFPMLLTIPQKSF